MKQTIKRVLAALLAAGLLVLCACSAKTAPAQEQEPEQTAAVETAPAEKPQEAASVEETPEKAEGEAQTSEEQPEAKKPAPEEPAEQPTEPEVRAPMDEQPAQEQPDAQDTPMTCTISISCATILSNTEPARCCGPPASRFSRWK